MEEFRIEKEVYDRILGVCSVPPETGGMIGGKDKRIYMLVVEEPNGEYEYRPDVNLLNKIIADWNNRGISFYGLFHSHGVNGKLSKGDVEYIKVIMHAMPICIDTLLFPVVLPQERMIPYMAKRIGEEVVIEEIELKIVSNQKVS